jgi:hypothetical protein
MKGFAIALVLFLLFACSGCGLAGLVDDLELTAPTTSLHLGGSVQLKVKKKGSWFRSYDLKNPAKTTYVTSGESTLVVEPDGMVTCVGTHHGPTESAVIGAWNGRSHGTLTLECLSDGPGPTLELTADSSVPLPENARNPWIPCCSEPLALNEGQQLKYTVRARSSGRDLTSTTTGTRYTLFFGSGVPDDSRPSIITGGPDYVSVKTFLVDSRQGTMTAPVSIGKLNRAVVIVFVRNGELVGWRDIVVIHPGGKLGDEQ